MAELAKFSVTVEVNGPMLMDVAFTWYPDKLSFPTLPYEYTVWEKMPAVPKVGDCVHLPIREAEFGENDSIALYVQQVSWATDHPEHPGWHAEIHLSTRIR